MTAKAIAIIPARGGSKRIPRKNVRLFAGRPVIARAIATAHESGCFSRIVVSTDDDEIAEVARQAGAEIPFLRSGELADDHAGTLPVIQDAVRRLELPPDGIVACIYPVVPLLRPATLADACNRLRQTMEISFVFAAAAFECPVQRGFRFNPEDGLQMLFPESYSARSQDLPPVYHDAGQFYFARAAAWLGASRVYQRDAVPWIMNRDDCVDVDTEEDWCRAERLFVLSGHGD
jgi:N-acylneuraminate cytidylyltransferase